MTLMKAMELLVVDKKVKSIGVSNFNIEQLNQVFEKCSIRPTVNQIEINPFCQNDEVVEFCQKNNIVVTVSLSKFFGFEVFFYKKLFISRHMLHLALLIGDGIDV
jgi:aryl-alcohol dehydrogenase-like predicted oxidoreductase